MGKYLNPGNEKFQSICRAEYVDKTGLIHATNPLLHTEHRFILVSRPRRFGKSYAAAMLCAYFGHGCTSRHLFEDKEIARLEPSLEGLGDYNILYFDMSSFKADALQKQKDLDRKAASKGETAQKLDWIDFLENEVTEDIREAYGEECASYSFFQTLKNAVEMTGRKFLWICDEWDLFIREDIPDANATDNYLEMMRRLFKTSDGYAESVFAGAYLTGIMPMKKMKGESAVSSFDNYTMLGQGALAPYTGFTESEVQALCRKYDISYEKMEEWYDGYRFPGVGAVFNPRSVMEAIRLREFDSYWTQTASYEKLRLQIELNIAGLRAQIFQLASGGTVRIDGIRFDNDLRDLKTANEVLTSMVHLGYLSYDAESKTVRIPNKELRKEFFATLAESSHEETAKMIRMADDLLEATWNMDEKKVAEVLEVAHRATGDTKHYNLEARLSETVRIAYYTAADYYVTIRELAGGEGFVDLAYIPRKGVDKPLMIIELKWDKPVHTALDQIREKKYPEDLQRFGGEVLLVGITYRVRGKRHICRIERL
ncbi:MAG: AAA family ATPase [Lachnospiraceae bacterium]|nr:AAA family ATPase [Lachnospiraceae bacterium]